MITHAFPPEGAAGVYRPLRFVRHLPSLGWHPTVITCDTDVFERYDPSLLSQVPKEVEVICVRNHDPWQAFQATRIRRIQKQLTEASAEQTTRIRSAQQNYMRSRARELVRSIEVRVYHPDIAMGWIAPAVRAAQLACWRNRPDVIWATAGPVSSFVIAQKLSKLTGVPYVLDFRDSWTITYNEFEERRPTWAKRYENRRMYRLLKSAQSVIFRFHAEAECYWQAYKDALVASKIYVIPNGYEGTIDDFLPAQRQRCEIFYAGTLSDYRYDSLLKALSFLKHSSPELASRLHLLFAGEDAESLANDAAALELSEIITTRGPTSQEEITKLSKQAHALLILGRPETMRGYELFAGAKLFGYLKAGMPILGILPDDETKKVLLRIGVTTVADVDSELEIVSMLRTFLDAWSQKKLSSLVPNQIACEAYSAERQTGDLVRALEGKTATDPFVPGSGEIPLSLRSEINRRARDLKRTSDFDANEEARA